MRPAPAPRPRYSSLVANTMNAAATTLRLPLGPRERPLDVDVGDGLRVAALRLDPRASTIDIEVGTIAAQEEGRISRRVNNSRRIV